MENLKQIKWSAFPPVTGKEKMITVLLVNQDYDSTPTYSIRDLIKKCGYRGKREKRGGFGWSRVVKAETFAIESLASEQWFKVANGVEVQILNENDEVMETHLIINGAFTTNKN